jgi:hypothetical protein
MSGGTAEEPILRTVAFKAARMPSTQPPGVSQIRQGTGTNAAREANDPALVSAVQSPSASVEPFTGQGIQENLKVGGDAPVNVHETVDRVLVGTFERADSLSVQQSSAVDAIKVHYES